MRLLNALDVLKKLTKSASVDHFVRDFAASRRLIFMSAQVFYIMVLIKAD